MLSPFLAEKRGGVKLLHTKISVGLFLRESALDDRIY